MADVILKNVTKIYENKVTAVKDANLTINDKEFVVLVGPSGCGKSTLLRMIAGLEEISEGTISIGDRIVNDIPPKDRDIAMVFQNYALYPHMTVFENMAFGLRLRKFPKEEIKERVGEAAELLGIEDYLQRKPKALSGGQRQRVAVGRAIVRKPAVFLFDEPLSNLDAKLRVQMRIEITKLHLRLGATMVYVTHDQVEAMTMGDRIVVMKDGNIQQIDTPMNLYNKPVNMFVAGFIGSPSMNFLKGRISRNTDVYFESENIRLKLENISGNGLDNLKNNADVTLGIRPEHITLHIPEGNDYGELNALVEVIEPMGNETFMYLKVGNQGLTIRGNIGNQVRINEHISIYFNVNMVHVFNTDTEVALI